MSNHYYPECGRVPDDQRCEANVPGHPSWNWQWARVAHRCPKRANQMRGDVAVCHVHGRAKEVKRYEPTT